MKTLIGVLDGSGRLRIAAAALLIGYGVAQYRISINQAEKRGAATANAKTEAQNAKVDQAGQRGSSNRGRPVPGSVQDLYRD